MKRSPGSDGEITLASRTARISAPSVRAVLDAATEPRGVWDAPDEPTILAEGVAAEVTTTGSARFEAVREAAETLLSERAGRTVPKAARPRLFGGFSFHVDGETDSPWEGFPDARFVLPRVQIVSVDTDDPEADREAWLTVNAVGPDADDAPIEQLLKRERKRAQSLPDPGPIAKPPGVESQTQTPRAEWYGGVRAAIERIEAGELRKVVLAQALRATPTTPLSIPDTLARLGGVSPDCYRFLVEPPIEGDGPSPSFFGATPERLVRLRGRTLETGALAGTTSRGETPMEDEWLAAELQKSDKNVHEHELVVDAIREQVEPFASSVTCGERSVRRLATIQHLWTPITAELATNEHVLSLVEALHPTPAVGGLPPEAALETIRATEPFDRGWYAAPVGWFDAAGNGSFAVALRSAVTRGHTATLFAGVGIVANSDPDREWEEAQLKYRPILDELERGE